MTLIIDAGVLFAQANAADPEHEAAATLLKAETDPLATLDRNDFLAVRPLYGDAFELLPHPPARPTSG